MQMISRRLCNQIAPPPPARPALVSTKWPPDSLECVAAVHSLATLCLTLNYARVQLQSYPARTLIVTMHGDRKTSRVLLLKRRQARVQGVGGRLT